jgi:MFS family permease
LTTSATPIHIGVLLLPFLGGALASAVVFGVLIRTRFIPLLAWCGCVAVAGGAAVLTGVAGGPQALVIVGSGLLGIGVGSSVAPALFSTGYSLPSTQLPRVFAMLELLRGAAAFAAGPIILHLAQTVSKSPTTGIRDAVWVCFAIAAGGASVAIYIFILGRGRLQVPDVETWTEGRQPAWHSPPLFAGIRRPKPMGDAAGTRNGQQLLDPASAESAQLEAYALAVRLARGEGEPDDHGPGDGD